ncbi:MAG: choice-of-anchor D domain-containing protein [Caldilineaceae bacterium]
MFVQNHTLASCTLSRFRCTSVPPVFWLLVLLVGLVWTMQWTPALAAAPEIDVYYGSVVISDGSTTPQANDCTDFNVANIDGVGLSCQYQIYNSGDADLHNVAVTIIGGQKDDFSLDYPPDAIIAPNTGSFFQVTFYPKATGTRRATIRIASSDSDENPYTFAIQGTATPAELDVFCHSTGVAIPDGSTTPSTNDCTDLGTANVDNNYSTYAQFNLNNSGNDYLRDVVVTIMGVDAEHFYLYNPSSDTIAPAGVSYFYLYFTPKSAGVRQATVSIASSDSDENPYTFVVQGTATPAELDVSCHSTGVAIPDGSTTPSTNDCTDLGTANVDNNYSTYAQFNLNNSGNDYLRDVVVTIMGVDAEHFYLYNPSSDTIAPAGVSYFYLYFTPKSAGVRQATVSIASSDSDENPYTFVVQGTATHAEIEVTHEGGTPIANGSQTPSVSNCTDFGAVEVYQQPACVFTIYNQGNDYLRNVSVTITGTNAAVFTLPYQPSDTISPGSYAQFYLYFHSQTVGLQKATVSISNSDSNENPYTFAVQGNATGPLTIAMTAEPATPTRNFRFTTNSRGTLGSTFLLDSDLYHSQWDTDGDGIWNTKTSNGVAARNYHVTAQLPFFWGVYGIDCDNPALVTNVGPTVNFNLTGSAGLSCTYHLKRYAMIRVQNFHDQNGNGRRNAAEPYLPSWRFTLQDSSNAVIQTLTTNDLGKGTFTDLPAGNYTICVEVPDGWRSTAPGGAPACYTRTVTWGNLLTLNFGNRASTLTAAEAADGSAVETPNELLTTPDDAELSEGDQVWLATAEPTDVTQSQRLYLPAVMR